jgi:PAS domain S-box-containing protein
MTGDTRADATEPAPAPARVLLVDDDPANLLALEAALGGQGWDLVRADSGAEALRRLLEADYAAVLLDLQMPALDGFATARLIRGRCRSRETPILFVTAHDSDKFPVVEAYRLGAVDYLVKPLVPDILRAKVAAFVDLFRKTERLRELERRERARAEAALRDSEQRFARFMEHLPGLAWIKDLRGRYVYANEAAARAFRTPRAALYGRADDEVFPPETAAQFRENDRRALAAGSGVQVVETLEHPDGAVHHSVVSKFPIPGQDGRPALVGGMAIDITDRVRAEQALREADRRKDEFLAVLAHELRNPLAPIRHALELLRLAGDPAAEAEARAVLDRQVRQMVRLVDDLLDVSRIRTGKVALRKERLDVAAALRSAVEVSRPLVEAAGHTLVVSLPAQPLYLDADPTRLAQVFGNLLNNAAKFTEPGGRVEVSAERAGDAAVVRVKDTGVGIAPEVLSRLFELFAQAGPPGGPSGGGLGVGLALAKSLVELHGGQVYAASGGPGRGSEFTVLLPLAAGACQEDTGAAPAPAGRGQARRVLVVDDNADAADTLARLLRVQGHRVGVAHDGPAALELARSLRPEVVFLDLGMPVMDGYAVARRLRSAPEAAGALLVALTGWGQEEDRRRSKEAGFDEHVTKPADLSEVQRLLDRPGPSRAPV